MLVDLGRNDIGKISQFGSVEVERYMAVQRYSHVMHIGSTVRGTIRPRQGRGGRRRGHSPCRNAVRCAQSSGPVRSSTSWRTTSGAFTAAPSATLTLPAIWTPASPSALPLKRTARYSSAPARASWPTACRRSEYQECINKAQAVVNAVKAWPREGWTDMILLIDNYDSFSIQSLSTGRLHRPGHPGHPQRRADDGGDSKHWLPSRIMLSPGPGQTRRLRCLRGCDPLFDRKNPDFGRLSGPSGHL